MENQIWDLRKPGPEGETNTGAGGKVGDEEGVGRAVLKEMGTRKRKAPWKMEGEPCMPRLKWAVKQGHRKRVGVPEMGKLGKHGCDLGGLRQTGPQKEVFVDWWGQK